MEENKSVEVTQAQNNEVEDFNVKEDRTFTQKEVNSIIQSRLEGMRKSASKHAEANYNAKMAELDARERKLNALETLRAKGLSDDFADMVANSKDIEATLEVLTKHFSNNKVAETKVENVEKSHGFQRIGAGEGNPFKHDPIKRAMGLE